MKRLYFDWIWQYKNGPWIGWNPIGIEFEYDKIEPAIAFKLVILGVGFGITWLCPWETKESEFYAEPGENAFIITFDPKEE